MFSIKKVVLPFILGLAFANCVAEQDEENLSREAEGANYFWTSLCMTINDQCPTGPGYENFAMMNDGGDYKCCLKRSSYSSFLVGNEVVQKNARSDKLKCKLVKRGRLYVAVVTNTQIDTGLKDHDNQGVEEQLCGVSKSTVSSDISDEEKEASFKPLILSADGASEQQIN
jgi:hypothetical protein